MGALERWLTSATSRVISPPETWVGQEAVGWRLLTRGFLTRQWHHLLHTLGKTTADNMPDQDDSAITKTIAGLIKTMWNALSKLWLDHLAIIHEKKSKPTRSPVTLQSLKDRVRLIHALKPETLPIHRHYFHEDIDDVLQKATTQSLQTYIEHYLPCILQSIKQRKLQCSPQLPPDHPTSDIHSSVNNPHFDTPCPNTASRNPHSPHPAQEEPTHRRHSRNRIAISGGG